MRCGYECWHSGQRRLQQYLSSCSLWRVSPTVLQWKGYRFFFFSREERRVHVHVYCADGEAKFWMEPKIELVKNYGLSKQQIVEIRKVVVEHKDEIVNAWHKHFGR
jgi:hypothetical protein